MGEIKIKSGNLFDTSIYNNDVYLHNCTVTNVSTSVTITSTGTDPFVGFVNSPGATVPERAQSMYISVKPNTTYTINMSSAPKCYCTQVDNSNVIKRGAQINLLPYRFTTDDSTAYVIIRLGDDTLQTGDSLTFESIQLLEGTYTAENIPEYKPYFLNKPAHQFTNGEWIDIPTHHFINGRWQGELTSQSPLKFRADGQMLDWRIEGKTSGNLVESFRTTENTAKFSICLLGMLDIKPSTSYTISFIMEKGVKAYFNEYLFVYEHFTGTGQRQVLNITTIANIDKNASTWVTEYGWILCKNWVNNENACNFREVMILEGTYTSETIPPYEPYGGVGDWDETAQRYKIPVTVNGVTTTLYTDHQLMDGDSLDYTTGQTTIPITQGDNTLTVGTAVQPSKVFVKFEG